VIDLHTHTNQSDGTADPAELIQQAVSIGLQALGISDHDTLAGYDMAVPAAAAAGLELICAVELSTRMPPTGDGARARSAHLLGYFLATPPTPEFREWLQVMQQARRNRNVALIARLQSLGIEITLEEVQALGRNLTGRPHFAQVLLKRGYVGSIQEAFNLYLADDAKAGVEREEPALLEGIRGIAADGGLPSLAHPVRLPQGRDPVGMRKLLSELVEIGLQGIEAYHSEHSPTDVELFETLAEEFHLVVTGGSDFHGDNKPDIQLGRGRGNLDISYALLEQMRQGGHCRTGSGC
jgi:hypothetical protein